MMHQEGPIRVLAADDHPAVRAGITALLADEPGIELVAFATDGAEAVRLFRSLRPQVVLMDLRMPHLDGVAATAMIRAIDPEARVIVLTTYDRDAGIDRATEAGAVAWLTKDAMIEQLVRAIRAAAGRR